MTNKDSSQSQLAANVSQSTPAGMNSSADTSLSPNTLASQVAFLQEFLASSPPTEDEAAGNISALLKQLETAEGVAQGVESNLDKLLENLEGMIEVLEENPGQSTEDGKSESHVLGSSELRKPNTHEKDAG